MDQVEKIKKQESAKIKYTLNAKEVLPTTIPFVLFFFFYAFTPRFACEKYLTLLSYIGIDVLLVLGLNLLMGYAGQISLGHAAFYGLGAYTSAILTTRPIETSIVPGFSTGIAIISGIAAFISLTSVSGWKLAAGVGALVLLGWIGALFHNSLLLILIYVLGMSLFCWISKLSWWKGAIVGAITGIIRLLTVWFLIGTYERAGTSPWTGMIVGIALTSVIAYLIGGQVLRLKGHYLAMATLGFGIIVEIVFRQWTDITGGSSDGIFGIPSIEIISSLPKPLQAIPRFFAGGELDMLKEYFYIVWGFVFIALILAVNIVKSRVGRAFRAVHGSEIAAETLGVDTGRYKVQVFVLSAAMASIAGSLHAHFAGIGYVNPSEFNFMVSVQLVVMVVVGGMASVWGSLFGASAIQLIKDRLLVLEQMDIKLFGSTLSGLEPVVFGALLITVMVLLPQGLARGLTEAASAIYRTIIRSGKRKVFEQ